MTTKSNLTQQCHNTFWIRELNGIRGNTVLAEHLALLRTGQLLINCVNILHTNEGQFRLSKEKNNMKMQMAARNCTKAEDIIGEEQRSRCTAELLGIGKIGG